MLSESGLRGTKVGYPYGKEPPLPWFVYRRLKKGEFYADDSNYAKREALEEQLARIGPYACIESWVPMENCWLTSYTLTYHPNE